MLQSIIIFFGFLSYCLCDSQSSEPVSSLFRLTEEARATMCPFLGFEGMRCFDNDHVKRTNRQLDSSFMKLPRGVGMSVDQSTGEIKALPVHLTYPEEGSHIWTDGFTGDMYDMINEAKLRPASKIAATYEANRTHIFQNASQLHTVWQQRFVDGKVRGGELARRPNMLEYSNGFFKNDEALALSQRVVSLYTLTLNASAIQLNSFARRALSHLTKTFNPSLYKAFIDVWGTHIVTSSLIGGMIEERAKVKRCFRASDNAMFAECLPFNNRSHINSSCAYYAAQTRVISKRRLGGDTDINHEHQWRNTLATGPALVQILEMVPWYEFVSDAAVKQNLQSAISCRQENIASVQEEAVLQIDARLLPCIAAPIGSAYFSRSASWKKNGITIAGGNGRGSLVNQLNLPHEIFIDDDGETLYIADYDNNRIVEYRIGASSGRVLAGGNEKESGANLLNHPVSVVVDKGRDCFYIADVDNNRVVRWPLRRGISGNTIIEGGTPIYLALDEQGFLYVSYVERNEVRRWRVGETEGTVVAGGNGAGNQLNQLNVPRKVFVDRNRSVYVAEWNNHRVVKWMEGAKEGIIVAGGHGNGSSLSQLSHPDGIVVDQWETVYVADRKNHRIMRWPKGAKEGQVILGGLGAGSRPDQLSNPIGLFFDRFGNLFVSDGGNDRIQKFEIY